MTCIKKIGRCMSIAQNRTEKKLNVPVRTKALISYNSVNGCHDNNLKIILNYKTKQFVKIY